MGGETPPPVERGCYFLLTPPPEALREPDDEPRDDELPLRETEPRDPPLDRPEDEEPTRAELRPDDELPERTDELPDVPRNEDGRE
jgi:hypothetical protein